MSFQNFHLFQLSSHFLLFLKTQHQYPEFGPKSSEIQKTTRKKSILAFRRRGYNSEMHNFLYETEFHPVLTLSFFFPERHHYCYIYFHCFYMCNCYNYLECWVSAFHTQIYSNYLTLRTSLEEGIVREKRPKDRVKTGWLKKKTLLWQHPKEADARDPNLRGLSRCSPLVPLALVAGSLGLSLWAHHSPLWQSLIRHWRCEASGNGARISRGSAPRGAMCLSSSPLPGCVRRLFVVFDPLPQSLWHPPFATLHNPNRRFSS